jgi:hypothetical protein
MCVNDSFAGKHSPLSPQPAHASLHRGERRLRQLSCAGLLRGRAGGAREFRRPGDLLNIPHRHVLLCAGWASPDHAWLYFYETGGAPEHWRPGLKRAPLDALLALGYQPLRYRGVAAETRTDGKQILTRAALSSAAVVSLPSVGEP